MPTLTLIFVFDLPQSPPLNACHAICIFARAQAGLGYIALNDILQKQGTKLWFPLDPGPGASIGGMCACRCSGSTAVRYGSMRENVLNLTVVMADGTVVRTAGAGRARKSSAGYDLTRLFVGSEGTLGIITEATLKLAVRPQHSHAVLLSFATEEQAAACARDTLTCGVTVGRCELLDTSMVRVINAANAGGPNAAWPERVTLMYEVTGISNESVVEQSRAIVDIARKNGSTHDSRISGKATRPDILIMMSCAMICVWHFIT